MPTTKPDPHEQLRDAAFHAWVALGEWLVIKDALSPKEQRAEFQQCYDELQEALKATQRKKKG